MANISEEWNQSVEDQGSEQEQAIFAENQRTYDGYRSLVEQDRMARQQRKRAADNALASMLIEARNSGNGMVPASMCAAVSQDCGMDIAGGVLTKDGNLHLLTHAQDGSVVEFPNGSGIITPANQFGVLQRTGLGKDLQKEIYGGFRKKYTAQQLAKIGIKEPVDTLKRDGVEVVGETGAFKRPVAEKHGVHVFASDGKGGFTRSDWTPEGGEETRDYGTRDPKYQGRWKVISSGPRRISDAYTDENGKRVEAQYENGKRYVNDKTGDEVWVKDGDTPPWVRGEMSDKERVAQINNEARAKLHASDNEAKANLQEQKGKQSKENATIQAEATKYKADKNLEGKKVSASQKGSESGKPTFTKNQVAAMKGMLELAYQTGMSEEEIESLKTKFNDRITSMASGEETSAGGETSGDGGTAGKVKYTDLKPGQKFTMTDKDGKKRRCVKTEKGYRYID